MTGVSVRSAANEAGGGASYAGDVSPQDAWRMLAEDPGAVLVDVRTRPEWMFVGIPDLSPLGKRPTLASWQVFPAMEVDAGFVDGLAKAGVAKDHPVLFICRSGGRSRSAAIAATKAGFARAYNVADGFEGPPDAERHRGRVGGWKAAGLPWVQE